MFQNDFQVIADNLQPVVICISIDWYFNAVRKYSQYLRACCLMSMNKNERNNDKRLISVKRNVQALSFLGVFSAVLMYLERVVFVAYMPIEYVGLYGLFQNILNFLSIADFGVSTALTYCLYEPLAHQRFDVVSAIMRMIRKIYVTLGAIIMIGGCICCWKIDFFVRPEDIVPNIRWYFFLFLFAQASGYFITSRAVLLNADQRQYINIIATQGGNCIQMILQMAVVVLLRNYFLYILSVVIINLAKNLSVYWISTLSYRDIFSKKYSKAEVPAEISNKLRFNIGPMFLHKISRVIISSTDTILLSMLFGTAIVGRYNNYILLVNGFMTVFWLLARSVTPSIGDVCVDSSGGSVIHLYDQIYYGNFMLSLISGIVFTSIAQAFIGFSFGIANELSLAIVFTLGLNLFLNSFRITNSTFRDAMGLFAPDWYKPILEAAVNIIVSYLLAIWIGPVGVIIGTAITYLGISIWIEPYVIITIGLKKSVGRYYGRTVLFIVLYFALASIALLLSNHIQIDNLLVSLCVNAILGLVVAVSGCLLLAVRNDTARHTLRQLWLLIKRR